MIMNDKESQIQNALKLKDQVNLDALARCHPSVMPMLAALSAETEVPETRMDDAEAADENSVEACMEDEIFDDSPEDDAPEVVDQVGRSYEARFRGLSMNSQCWVYGSLIEGPAGPSIVTDAPDGSVTTTPVRPDSVSQYTGMVDVTGRMIYAKDVLEVVGQFHQDPCAIRWIPGPLGGRFQLTKVDAPQIAVPYYGQTFRVIGTIVTGIEEAQDW